jgi:hypothetical protein
MKRFGWLFFAHVLLFLAPANGSPKALQGGPPSTPAGFAGVAQSTTSIQWSWGSSTGATTITYEIHADPETSPPTVIASGLTSLSYVENGLSENTRYGRHVHARGLDGVTSPASNPDRRYTLIHTATTADFKVTLSSDTSSAIKVVEPPNAFADQTGVEIFRTVPTFLMISAMSPTYNAAENGLAPDKDYCYNIEFQNGDGIRSGPGPSPLCVHTPPTHPGDDGCHVHVDKQVICPNHEQARFEWDVTLNSTEKAAVVAYSDTQLVLVLQGSQVIEIQTGRRPREHVKERLRGWCRVFDSAAEANVAAKRVRDLFKTRKRLINQHRELRDQINQNQDKMDELRADFYIREGGIIGLKDANEAIALSFDSYSDMMQARRAGLIKDKKALGQIRNQLDALQKVIDNLDAAEEKPIQKIEKDIDPKVSAVLGPPVQCIVAEIASVVFEPIARGLDDNPLWGGGQRIRPDADAIGGDASPEVTVKATATPKVAGLEVHFKRFDRDDISSDDLEIDENGRDGSDNFGSTKLGQAWGFGGAPTTDGVTDAQGECRKTFRVTMQPGDNFEAAAACDKGDIDPLTDNDASMLKVPYRLSSGMLTVWRRVFIERESMGPPQPNDKRYVGIGRTVEVTLFDEDRQAIVRFRPDDADLLAESENRWVPGRFLDVTTAAGYEIVSSTTRGGLIDVTVKTRFETGPRGQKLVIHPAPGFQGFLYDDDFQFGRGTGVSDRKLLPILPDLSELVNTYQDAYLDIIGTVPGLAGSQQGQGNLPVRVNFLKDTFPPDTDDSAQLNAYINTFFNAQGSRTDSCWIGYLVTAFQGSLESDNDPDGLTGAIFGQNARGGVNGDLAIGAAAYAETSRDVLTEAGLLDAFPFLFAKTHAHEFGHQLGLTESSGGIMVVDAGRGGSKDPTISSPVTFTQMHKIRRYPESPGRRGLGRPN